MPPTPWGLVAGEAPLRAARAMEPGGSPRPGPRTPAPLLPQDWKEKYIHENYTKALAGKLVETVRTGRLLLRTETRLG